MNKTKLEMEFLDEDNKKFIVTVDQPRSDITSEEVKVAMDEIVSLNVFTSSMADLVESVEARVITTTINTLEI